MPWSDFCLILLLTGGSTLLARTVPVLLFARRRIPESAKSLLGYIPVSAFAALVMSDVFKPDAFALGPWPALLPGLALIPVVLAARKTRSLGVCIVVGILAFWGLQQV
jgi:branched-subunit amino acid transport protein